MNAPDFMIVGVGKGGTSSMFVNLAQHPRLQRPHGEGFRGKELGYFSKHFENGLDWYKAQFPKRRKGCLLFEGTPTYISDPDYVQDRIRALVPAVKAVVMLRNPTDRAWSSYWWNFSRPPHKHSIRRLLDSDYHVLRRGVYVDQIIRWHGLFPKENLLILRTEDYFSDMRPALKSVYEFLGVEEIYPDEPSRLDPWEWRKAMYPAREMPERYRTAVDEFYRPHNERLSEYLGEDWTWR